MASKTIHFKAHENATVAADGNTSAVGVKGATKVSLYGNATLGGTTPSFKAQVQTKDAAGNWHNLGNGVTITATGTLKELGLTGPFGDSFRVNIDVDVANADETYTGVDLVLAIEYDPVA